MAPSTMGSACPRWLPRPKRRLSIVGSTAELRLQRHAPRARWRRPDLPGARADQARRPGGDGRVVERVVLLDRQPPADEGRRDGGLLVDLALALGVDGALEDGLVLLHLEALVTGVEEASGDDDQQVLRRVPVRRVRLAVVAAVAA